MRTIADVFEIWYKDTTFILYRKFFTAKIAIMDKYLTFTNQTNAYNVAFIRKNKQNYMYQLLYIKFLPILALFYSKYSTSRPIDNDNDIAIHDIWQINIKYLIKSSNFHHKQ